MSNFTIDFEVKYQIVLIRFSVLSFFYIFGKVRTVYHFQLSFQVDRN